MAKISQLPVAAALTGQESFPLVQGTTTKRGTVDQFVDQVIPHVQNYYKGDKGDPGAAGNVAADIDQLRDAAITNVTMLFDGVPYLWTPGDFSALIDDTAYVASDHVASSAGAWKRQDASRILTGDGRDVEQRLDVLRSMSEQSASAVAITGGTLRNIRLDRVREPGIYNLRRDSLPDWSAALARHVNGLGRAKIMLPGDSTMSGVCSNPNSPSVDSRRRAWPMWLAHEMSGMLDIKAQANSIFCDGFEGSNIVNFDPRLALEPGWTIHPTLFCTGGRAFYHEGGGIPKMTWNPGVPTDTLDVYYVRYPGYSEFIVSKDGVTGYGSEFTTGPIGIGVKTFTRSEDFDHLWTIQKSASTPAPPLLIVGLDAYMAADKPISVMNMGASGSHGYDWVADNQPYNFEAALPAIANPTLPGERFCLTIPCLTINDTIHGTSEATYKAAAQKIINTGRACGDVLLMIGIPSTAGAATLERQQEVAGWVYDLADLNDLPLINMQEIWISQSYNPMRGYYGDGLHATSIGYRNIARLVARIITNL